MGYLPTGVAPVLRRALDRMTRLLILSATAVLYANGAALSARLCRSLSNRIPPKKQATANSKTNKARRVN